MSRLTFLSVVVSGVTTFLFAVALTMGSIVLNARLHPDKKTRPPAPPPGPIVEVSDQIYNLGEAKRFLKAGVALELDLTGKSTKEAQAFAEEMKKREPQIRDIIIRVINKRTFAEVNSPQGKQMMKNDIMKAVDEVLARGQIKTVLFTSFAAQ